MAQNRSIDIIVTQTINDASSVPDYIELFTVPKGYKLINATIDIAADMLETVNAFDYKTVKFRPTTKGTDITANIAGLYKELSPLAKKFGKGELLKLDEEYPENKVLVLIPEGFDSVNSGDFPVTFAFRLQGILEYITQ